jgi:hypothetical protein
MYVAIVLAGTAVGPVIVTVGTMPPLWQALQMVPPVAGFPEKPVIPVGKAQTSVVVRSVKRTAVPQITQNFLFIAYLSFLLDDPVLTQRGADAK